MATSETSIANQALRLIGEAPILSMDDDLEPARVCKTLYPDTRDTLLASTPWHFATWRVWLARLATPPAFGWSAAFQLPQGGAGQPPYALEPIWEVWPRSTRFTVENRTVLADTEQLGIVYTGRITDTLKYPPAFTQALILALASQIAYPRTGNHSLAQSLMQQAAVAGARARTLDGLSSDKGKQLAAPDWVAVRTTNGG
jgi:hypothetical protein